MSRGDRDSFATNVTGTGRLQVVEVCERDADPQLPAGQTRIIDSLLVLRAQLSLTLKEGRLEATLGAGVSVDLGELRCSGAGTEEDPAQPIPLFCN